MERQLDHKETDSTWRPMPDRTLAERRKMMQAWADTCDELEACGEVVRCTEKPRLTYQVKAGRLVQPHQPPLTKTIY